MRVLYLILLIAAGVCFALAAVIPSWTIARHSRPAMNSQTPRPVSVDLLAVGLLLWVLVPLIQTADRLGD